VQAVWANIRSNGGFFQPQGTTALTVTWGWTPQNPN
jgi:hypothetical protein